MRELPKGWALAPVADLADLISGPAFQSAHFRTDGEGVRLLRGDNIEPGSLRWRDARYWPPDCLAGYEHLNVAAGDLILAMDRPLVSSGLKLAVVQDDDLPALLVQRVARIRTHRGVCGSYLHYALLRDEFKRHLAGEQTGTQLPHISLKQIGTFECPVAPFSEQERIVALIEEVFSKVDSGEAGLRTVRQLLRRMRDAVLSFAVTGRLVCQDPHDAAATKVLADLGIQSVPGADGELALPDGWAWATLGSISASVRNGIFVSRPPEVPPGVPILRIGAVRRLELDIADVRYAPVDVEDPAIRRALLAPGDLLFTRYNGNPKFVGACAVVPGMKGPLLHPDKLIRVVVDRRVAEPRFLAIAASAGSSRSFIEQATKTTAGQAGISGSDLKLAPIPVPPLAEQSRIVAEVERQLSFIGVCERSVDAGLEVSAAYRRSVLKAAFEGRLVSQDPTDEPASVLLERIRAERAAAPKPKKRRAQATA